MITNAAERTLRRRHPLVLSTPRFQYLTVKRDNSEAAGSVASTFDIPPSAREAYRFEPGQFLTLRATVNGEDVRRSYSISSPRSRLAQAGELEIGIRPVLGGLFSNWATNSIKVGDKINVMTPDGRFTVRKQRAIHRVGFAAGSGITPILSIVASTLEEQPESKFTLVLGNRRMSSVMFNEELQHLSVWVCWPITSSPNNRNVHGSGQHVSGQTPTVWSPSARCLAWATWIWDARLS